MLINLNPKIENTIKKLARESWGSTIYHPTNPKFWQKITYFFPRGGSGVPRLTHFRHILRILEPLVNPGPFFKKWFFIFSDAKIVKIINFHMVKFQTSFFSFIFFVWEVLVGAIVNLLKIQATQASASATQRKGQSLSFCARPWALGSKRTLQSSAKRPKTPLAAPVIRGRLKMVAEILRLVFSPSCFKKVVPKSSAKRSGLENQLCSGSGEFCWSAGASSWN